jgi:hypothetical protein
LRRQRNSSIHSHPIPSSSRTPASDDSNVMPCFLPDFMHSHPFQAFSRQVLLHLSHTWCVVSVGVRVWWKPSRNSEGSIESEEGDCLRGILVGVSSSPSRRRYYVPAPFLFTVSFLCPGHMIGPSNLHQKNRGSQIGCNGVGTNKLYSC